MPGSPLVRVFVTLVGYLAACAIFIVVRDWWFVWALLAIVLVVATAVALHAQVRSQLVVPGASLALRVLLIGLFLGVGGAMFLAWRIADKTDGWGFFGIATAFMGLGLLIGQGRRSDGFCRIAGPLVLCGSGVAIIIGLIGIAPNSGTWAKVLLIAGIAIAPAGLSFTSAVVNSNLSGAPNAPAPSRSVLATKNTLSRRLCYVGLVLFVGTTVAIVALGVGWRWVVLWGLVLFVLVVTTTARSNGDTAMLVAGAAVVWTLAQPGVPLPKTLQPHDGDTVMVAMGDSFMSGEGAPTYFKGTNTKGKNQCRRAPTAYAARLVGSHAAAVPDHLVFLACSGAVAANIYSEPQQPDDPPGSNGGLTQLANLAQQRDRSHLHIEFVLLSIGGNDALFGSIAKTCVLPGNCAALGNAWLDHLSRVESLLDVTYAKIAGALPGVQVIVVPYPDAIGDKKCDDATFSRREQVFLDIFTKALNEAVRRAAGRAGFEYAETMRGALKGIQLCDGRHGKAGVNFLKANPVEGLTEEALNPANWFHNSLHPNKDGHAAMSRTLERWLIDNPHAATPVDGVGGAGAVDATGLGVTCRNLSEAALANCTNDWALERTSGFVLSRGWLIVLAIGGAWLIALRMVFSWRTR